MNDAIINAGHERFCGVRYFGSLDGLRCLSIVGVIWCHAVGGTGGTSFLSRGYLGVNLFFVISGFLITTLLLRERDRNGEISLRLFYARRMLRIFPLYYAVLGVYTAMVFVMERHSPEGRLFFHNLPFYATYTNNILSSSSVDGQTMRRIIFVFAWSLATEEQFYLVWPWVLRFLKGWLPLAIILAAIGVDQVASFGLLPRFLPEGGRLQVGLASISTGICLGVLLAQSLHNRRTYCIVRQILGMKWSSLAVGLLAIGVLCVPMHDSPAYRMMVEVILTLFVGACVIREDHALAGVLRIGLFRRVGIVSYGMYLLHMLTLHTVDAVLGHMHIDNRWVLFVCGLPITYLVAEFSYHRFEGLFLRLKDRLGVDNRVVRANEVTIPDGAKRDLQPAANT